MAAADLLKECHRICDAEAVGTPHETVEHVLGYRTQVDGGRDVGFLDKKRKELLKMMQPAKLAGLSETDRELVGAAEKRLKECWEAFLAFKSSREKAKGGDDSDADEADGILRELPPYKDRAGRLPNDDEPRHQNDLKAIVSKWTFSSLSQASNVPRRPDTTAVTTMRDFCNPFLRQLVEQVRTEAKGVRRTDCSTVAVDAKYLWQAENNGRTHVFEVCLPEVTYHPANLLVYLESSHFELPAEECPLIGRMLGILLQCEGDVHPNEPTRVHVEFNRPYDEALVNANVPNMKKGCRLVVLSALVSEGRKYAACKCARSPPFAREFLGHPAALPDERRKAAATRGSEAGDEGLGRIIAPEPPAEDREIKMDGLDASQQAAVRGCVLSSSPINIIRGPPGTGKTRVVVEFLRNLAVGPERKACVAVPSNAAVHVGLRGFMKYCKGNVHEGSDGVAHRVALLGVHDRVPRDLEHFSADKLAHDIRGWVHTARKEIFDKEMPVDNPALVSAAWGKVHEAAARYNAFAADVRRRILPAPAQRVPAVAIPFFAKGKKPSARDVRSLREELFERVDELQSLQLDQLCFEAASIVFITLISAGRASLAAVKGVEYLIVDEAAQAVEPDIMVAFEHEPAKLLLVGDIKQLRPTLPASHNELGYGESTMERLLLKAKYPSFILQTQYRMHPDIFAFPNRQFYGSEYDLATADSVTNRADIFASRGPLYVPVPNHSPVEASVARGSAPQPAGGAGSARCEQPPGSSSSSAPANGHLPQSSGAHGPRPGADWMMQQALAASVANGNLPQVDNSLGASLAQLMRQYNLEHLASADSVAYSLWENLVPLMQQYIYYYPDSVANGYLPALEYFLRASLMQLMQQYSSEHLAPADSVANEHYSPFDNPLWKNLMQLRQQYSSEHLAPADSVDYSQFEYPYAACAAPAHVPQSDHEYHSSQYPTATDAATNRHDVRNLPPPAPVSRPYRPPYLLRKYDKPPVPEYLLKPLAFVNVNGSEDRLAEDSTSFVHYREASAVLSIISDLFRQGVSPKDIGVISFYMDQVWVLSHERFFAD
ncbi:putative helicase MAGATAMA 3 [Diplonema papillatum]|nr:putative helicase MAGATAMA 3 [Diplonema papillatum]